MYVLGFLSSYFLIAGQPRARLMGLYGPRLQGLILHVAIGLMIGARLGYVLFYQFGNFGHYLHNPLEIIAVWHGGMSFHGGLLGGAAAVVFFCRRSGLPILQVADAVIVTVPVGLFFGRVGNFINGELFGRPSTLPWAMVFPEGGPLPRHPSQLYEALLEGVVLFIVLWKLKDLELKPGALVCFFLGGYGALRFFVEFFRQPDEHIGLFWGVFSMGQFLCAAMVLGAALVWILLNARGSGSACENR